MTFTIKTQELQEMVGRSIQCVTNNKLIPLTSLMSISVKSAVLLLTTTDATNFYYNYSKTKVDCEDFEVSVLADLFTKLIQKTTSENVTIEIEGEIFIHIMLRAFDLHSHIPARHGACGQLRRFAGEDGGGVDIIERGELEQQADGDIRLARFVGAVFLRRDLHAAGDFLHRIIADLAQFADAHGDLPLLHGHVTSPAFRKDVQKYTPERKSMQARFCNVCGAVRLLRAGVAA